jgi:hypothetical protein
VRELEQERESLKRAVTFFARGDRSGTEQIRGIFDESEQTYGSPRIFKGSSSAAAWRSARSASPG